MKLFRVQHHHEVLGWMTIPFAEGSRRYCDGWVDCMDSIYPSRPVRIICIENILQPKVFTVVRETEGQAAPHVN